MIATVKANSAKQARELLENLGWIAGQPVREGEGKGWGVYLANVSGNGKLSGELVHGARWNYSKDCWAKIRSELVSIEKGCVEERLALGDLLGV